MDLINDTEMIGGDSLEKEKKKKKMRGINTINRSCDHRVDQFIYVYTFVRSFYLRAPRARARFYFVFLSSCLSLSTFEQVYARMDTMYSLFYLPPFSLVLGQQQRRGQYIKKKRRCLLLRKRYTLSLLPINLRYNDVHSSNT